MDKVENEYVEFWFENGLLRNNLKKPIHVTEEIMVELIEMRKKISNGTNQYWLQDISNLKSIDKKSRDIAEKEGQELLYASASLVNSHITKFMFNTFLKLKKTEIPFRAFTKEEDAVKWLLSVKEANELNLNSIY